MLGKILRIISEGHNVSVDDIAAGLGVSSEITHVMIEDLVRRGMLREVVSATSGVCGSSCGGCSQNCDSRTGGIKFWELIKN